MARRNNRLTAQQWAKLVTEQEASGDPIDVFCLRKGVGKSTFAKWRRRLLDNSSRPLLGGSADKPRGFVEAVPPSNVVVSLVLAGGVRLELPVTLGPQAIAAFAHAVVTHERG